MMTTNLFVIANVKQLRTGGIFRILLPFFRTYWGVGVLYSAMFDSFHSRVEFGTILEGLRNFGGGGGVEHLKLPTLRTPLLTCTVVCKMQTRKGSNCHYMYKHFWIRGTPLLGFFLSRTGWGAKLVLECAQKTNVCFSLLSQLALLIASIKCRNSCQKDNQQPSAL